MKIYYEAGTDRNHFSDGLSTEPNLFALSYNNWDDFGYKTTLNAVLFVNGEIILKLSLKMLIPNIDFTAEYLNGLREQGWNGFFPVPNAEYISVPNEINFYPALISKIGVEESIKVLKEIRDAGYLIKVLDDKQSLTLAEENGFDTSLMREGGARKAFRDGWLAISDEEPSTINDFILNFPRKKQGSQPIKFKFNSRLLPYDINVLIGANGIGKSYCLKSLVEYWLRINNGSKIELEQSGHIPFDMTPNISKLILVSYSPFEEYPIDLSDSDLHDKNAYRYFGFRQRIERDSVSRIGISHNLPAQDSINSLLKAFDDDNNFNFMRNWIGKVEVINDVLKAAIDYDQLALVLTNTGEIEPFLSPEYLIDIDGVKHLIMNTDAYSELDYLDINSHIDFHKGVVFIKDDTQMDLSSGQRLFCYIVVNVAGEIKQDSLVLIDEPELFLHPTLEIKFISMLKKVLKAFNSKAILATHSLTIAREIPTNCVHVFRELEDGLDVVHPPFETFGGDIQRISTYVFSDESVTKPFDEWIESKASEYVDSNAFIKDLGKEINEEILIKLLNSEVSIGS